MCVGLKKEEEEEEREGLLFKCLFYLFINSYVLITCFLMSSCPLARKCVSSMLEILAELTDDEKKVQK